MPKTYSDLFAEIRQSVKLLSLDELKARLEQRKEKPFTLVDVREKDEFRAGFIPGAVHIPRAHLEMQAEQKLPDKNAEIILYCAGGTRSGYDQEKSPLCLDTSQEEDAENGVAANEPPPCCVPPAGWLPFNARVVASS